MKSVLIKTRCQKHVLLVTDGFFVFNMNICPTRTNETDARDV